MQVHVKTPHIDIHIQGEEYKPLIDLLKKDFGEELVEITENEDELVEITSTDWFKEMKPGAAETVEIHRSNLKMTQAELGKAIGGRSKQYISDIEKGRRTISLDLAKRLGEVLGHSYKTYV
jgi:DNA-binding XRE family transcriptional regulator